MSYNQSAYGHINTLCLSPLANYIYAIQFIAIYSIKIGTLDIIQLWLTRVFILVLWISRLIMQITQPQNKWKKHFNSSSPKFCFSLLLSINNFNEKHFCYCSCCWLLLDITQKLYANSVHHINFFPQHFAIIKLFQISTRRVCCVLCRARSWLKDMLGEIHYVNLFTKWAGGPCVALNEWIGDWSQRIKN